MQAGLAPTTTKKYKIVFLGDLSVGKTSIINQFIYGTFDHSHQPTIGIDFLSKTMYLDDRTIRLQLWDTAGQERFRSLIPNYIRDCSVAVLVYDITQRQSYLNIDRWVEDIRNERGSDVIVMLVGNKVDISDKRAVTTEEGKGKAADLNLHFIEASAKTGESIKNLFRNIAQELPGMQGVPLANNADFVGEGGFKVQPGADGARAKTEKCTC